MSWIKIDDQYSHHPKIIITGAIGVAIHVASLCYSSRYLTDGFIPQNALPLVLSIIDGPGIIPEIKAMNWPQIMVDSGLWEKADGGYLIHDYLVYNPRKDKVLADRKAKSEAGQKGMESRWGSTKKRPKKANNKANNSRYTPVKGNSITRPDPQPLPDPDPFMKKDGTEAPQSDFHKIIKYFTDEHLRIFGIKYDFKSGKDANLIKDLFKTYNFDELKALINALFATTDKFLIEKGRTIGTLSWASNTLAQKALAKSPTEVYLASQRRPSGE
jgi:hypothetical protein